MKKMNNMDIKTKINKEKIIVCTGISLLVLLASSIGISKNDKKIDHESEVCFITKLTNNVEHQIKEIKDNNSDIKKVEYIPEYQNVEYYAYEYNDGHIKKIAETKIPTPDGIEYVVNDDNDLVCIYSDEKYPVLKISYMNKDQLIVEEKILKLDKKY